MGCVPSKQMKQKISEVFSFDTTLKFDYTSGTEQRKLYLN
jgi:hypothetical protein